MKFTEEKLERAFTELLEQEGYQHRLGNTIVRSADEVLIEADLHDNVYLYSTEMLYLIQFASQSFVFSC